MNKPNRPHHGPAPLTPTADLCDAHEEALKAGTLRVLPPVFSNYGGQTEIAGPVATLKCFEDNGLLRKTLESPGLGRVLMVDAGGSDRCALVGASLAMLAVKNGWAGIVVNGCVRDTAEIVEAELGIWAIATHPRRPEQKGSGELDLVLDMAGVRVCPGNWCYADSDGVIVSDKKLGDLIKN